MTIETEKFASVPLFENLDQQEIMKLLKISEHSMVKQGDEIIRQGEPGDGVYIIAAGAFEVLKSGTENKVLARLEELSFFGEMSLVTESSCAASVVCMEDGRLTKIPRVQFNRLLEKGDLTAYKVVRNMCRMLATRLARVEEELVS